MFESKLATMINEAVDDCITYGAGRTEQRINGADYKVVADWAENETDIEVAIFENRILRLSYTETIPEQYR